MLLITQFNISCYLISSKIIIRKFFPNCRCFVIIATALIHSSAAFDEYSYQQIINKQHNQPLNGSLLITKLLNVNGEASSEDESTRRVSSVKINQSLDIATSDRVQQDDDQSLSDKSLSKNPKYVNKSASSADKKNSMLMKKSLSASQSRAAEDSSWKCPNITDNRSLECGCDVPLTLRCSGDVHGLALIAEGLRKSSSFVSILDCTLKNVTVLNEPKIFEGVSLSGLFISSGEIKRVHRSAFNGLKTPLQILGLPNNALNTVPSNSLQQLTSLDRLDLSNNEIKMLSSTDFVVRFSLLNFVDWEFILNLYVVASKTFLLGDKRESNFVDLVEDISAFEESSHSKAQRQQAGRFSRQPQNHRRVYQSTRVRPAVESYQRPVDLQDSPAYQRFGNLEPRTEFVLKYRVWFFQ